MSFTLLDAHLKKLESLEHAMSILRVDEATQMPAGGGEKRAEAVAALASMHHEQATAPEVGDWIATAEVEELSEDQRAAVRELRRVYTNMTCLPTDFVRRQTEATMRCEQMWRELRPRGDWASFQPALEGVVRLVREEAALRADVLKLDPYDALIEQFDPGGRAADVTPVFAALKVFLMDFVPEALARQERAREQKPLKPFNAPFAIDKQRELGLAMMAALGFDLTHGRLDVSHHPFCGGVPSDVRITTRYSTADFLSALMGTLHETGHALYEQGLPVEWQHWPLGKARGMAMHESQSLFVEKQIARSAEFWEWAMPQVKTHLGDDSLEDFTLGDLLAQVHRIERGLIRVEADEATYPLHVILRYELEQELVAGRMEVADVPEAWHAKMMEYLGLPTIDSPQDGPMQDVHWAAGAFGYFPSYTLGALTAAQLWSALEKEIPDARENMRRGTFEAINDWRREKIWSEASRWPPQELLQRATGEPLNPEHFMNHLKRRYLN